MNGRSVALKTVKLRLLPSAACGFVALCCSVSSCLAAEIAGTCKRAADGDTIEVLDAGNTRHRVRLATIDALELDQPFGADARNLLAALCERRRVRVVSHKTDPYKRLVGVVYAGDDDMELNYALLDAGMAWHFKRYAHEQTAIDRARYALGEGRAREQRRGLWSDDHPVEPWVWRRSRKQQGAAAVR